MSFMNYRELRKWAQESYTPLYALLRTRSMPPWSADTAVGEFLNREYMPQSEIDLMIKWIDEDYPRGDGDYAQAPESSEEWAFGKPDLVLRLPEYTVPEDVEGEYKTFEITIDLPDDRWVVAAELKPGNALTVSTVSAEPLGTFPRGQRIIEYPEPWARRLPKGASISVTVHYVNEQGVAETDQSSIAVRFAASDRVPLEYLFETMPAEPFTIPAGKAGFNVTAQFKFEQRSRIVSLNPVMRERGMSVIYMVTFPDGTSKMLLSIPEWNPNWQYIYWLEQPMTVPKGTVVKAVAIFDNSEGNLKNPDPWSDVSTGPSGEIFEGRVGYSPSRP